VWGKQWLKRRMPLAQASKKLPTMQGYALRSELKLILRFSEVTLCCLVGGYQILRGTSFLQYHENGICVPVAEL
jgi:hypothetical protein